MNAYNGVSGSSQILYDLANKLTIDSNGTFIDGSALDSAFHAGQGIVNGASPNSMISIDGTDTTGSITGQTINHGYDLVKKNGFGANLTGFIAEAGLWPIAFSSSQRSLMNSNQHRFWNF